MSAHDDGGPAFPGPDGVLNGNGDFIPAAYPGMTLRDYFAIHASDGDVRFAMEWLCQPGSGFTGTPAELRAIARYAFADAMLKVRQS